MTAKSDSYTEVISSEALASRSRELGAQLTEDFRNKEPVFVGVLHGSLPFLSDLVRQIATPLEVDFLALSRFGEGGRVRIAMDTEISLEGRHVVLVEDIVDTGLTLSYVRRLLETRDLASLATVTLIDKAPRRIVEVPLEYRGFEVGDEFLLGYGLDWEGKYRNLRSIWVVLDLATLQHDAASLANKVFSAHGDNLIS
ncbi:MAG: hypoxanthine phosphoribosyltransferase [Acidimicrobiia bacterium]